MSGRRQTNKTILVVCEGQTEEAYFGTLKGKGPLSIQTKCAYGGSASAIVQKAIAWTSEDRDYDQIWVVLDCDSDTTKLVQVKSAIRQAMRKKLFCAFSSPDFEFWILLHFTNASLQSSVSSIRKELTKFWKEEFREAYAKNSQNLKKLSGHKDAAIARSSRLCAELCRQACPFPSPNVSTVHLLCNAISSGLAEASESVLADIERTFLAWSATQ